MKQFILIFSIAIMASCSKENPQSYYPNEQSPEKTSGLKTIYGGVKPKIKFKHHGLDPQGNRNPGCDSPLGLCVIFGIRSVTGTYEFTREERDDRIGTSEFLFYPGDTLVEIVPDMPFAFSDHSTLIEEDIMMDTELAEQYGFHKITLKKGRYSVDPDIGPFGSSLIKIEAAR